MYYVQTADKLTRTSVWLEKLPGGIEYLRDVVINDRLSIADDLEHQMQYVVDTYQCEWKTVVNDPELRKRFRQFVNTDETEPTIEFVDQRGQRRPADWPTDAELVQLGPSPSPSPSAVEEAADDASWVAVGSIDDFPIDGGACVKYGDVQIAVYRFDARGEWYATQNMCPHRREFVLSRGILGDASGVPKVACPLHKKTFSLKTGESLAGEDYNIRTFPVRVSEGEVSLLLPPEEQLNAELATEHFCTAATACVS